MSSNDQGAHGSAFKGGAAPPGPRLLARLVLQHYRQIWLASSVSGFLGRLVLWGLALLSLVGLVGTLYVAIFLLAVFWSWVWPEHAGGALAFLEGRSVSILFASVSLAAAFGGSFGERYLLRYSRARFKATPFSKERREETLTAIRSGLGESDPGFEMIDLGEAGSGITNLDLNNTLWHQPAIAFRELKGRWQANKIDLPRRRRQDKSDLARHVVYDAFRKRRPTFNSAKIGLRSLSFEGKPHAAKQRTDYLSSMISDQTAFKTIAKIDRADPFVLSDGVERFIDDQGRMRPFHDERNFVSNQLGASTLAFTRDGHLVYILQSENSEQNADKHVPSGSGSLDWEDLSAAKAGNLTAAVLHGAGRELKEESALHWSLFPPRRAIEFEIRVFAYLRYVYRAGKPEFFCLARLAATKEQIARVKPKRKERRYTTQILFSQDRITPEMPTGDQLLRICDEYSSLADAAFPLACALIILKRCADERNMADEYLSFLYPRDTATSP